MRISVIVIPGAKVTQIQQSIDGSLKVWLKSKPVEGAANKELISFLAGFYKVKKNDILIISGLTSRNKIVEVREA